MKPTETNMVAGCVAEVAHFDNVPVAAWEQAIGGYHPAEKWLKDRKGRALTQDAERQTGGG